jgi:hypothetical protein
MSAPKTVYTTRGRIYRYALMISFTTTRSSTRRASNAPNASVTDPNSRSRIWSPTLLLDSFAVYLEVYGDFDAAGLGMTTTFADLLSRLNSASPRVVTEEKKRFEAIIKLSWE